MWKCFLNSVLYLESRAIVSGCVLSTKARRDIFGGFPGSPQGQEIFGCHTPIVYVLNIFVLFLGQ